MKTKEQKIEELKKAIDLLFEQEMDYPASVLVVKLQGLYQEDK